MAVSGVSRTIVQPSVQSNHVAGAHQAPGDPHQDAHGGRDQNRDADQGGDGAPSSHARADETVPVGKTGIKLDVTA